MSLAIIESKYIKKVSIKPFWPQQSQKQGWVNVNKVKCTIKKWDLKNFNHNIVIKFSCPRQVRLKTFTWNIYKRCEGLIFLDGEMTFSFTLLL